MEKEGRRDDRYIDGYNPVCTLSDQLRTRKFLQVLTISPRICRACRPTPCPHFAAHAQSSMCQSKAKLGALRKVLRKRKTAGRPRRGRGRCAPRPEGLRCSAGRTGSAGKPTPSHSRGLYRSLLWAADKCGGLKLTHKREVTTQPGRVAGAPRFLAAVDEC